MVNTGKPSSGYHMCRKRRIKCDEAKPHCMRCQKSKRICPGYRDSAQLQRFGGSKPTKKQRHGSDKIHNLSFDELIDSVILSTATSLDSPDYSIDSTTLAPSRESSRTPYEKTTLTLFHFQIPIEEQTTCFFTTDFVLTPRKASGIGFLSFVLPFSALAKTNSPFHQALSASSLASFGSRFKRKSLLPKAHEQYIECVKGIKKSLLEPRAAKDDSILASILLLTIFEQVTLVETSLNGWSSHIEGAIALVRHRGEESFKTPLSRNLFNGVRELMTIHFMAKAKPIDRSIDWLYHTPDDIFEHRYATLNMRLVDLRAINNTVTVPGPRTTSKTVKVVELLHKARTLEKEYREWFESLSSSYSAMAWLDSETTTTTNIATSISHPGRIDQYEELYQAYEYNVARSSQILIWTIILRCIAWLREDTDYRISTEYRDAARRCRELIQDIVSSIPYCFLWDQDCSTMMPDKVRFSCEHVEMKGVSAVYLMWPLYVAGNSDFATSSQRLFAKGKLAYIAGSVGICQASLILQISAPHPSTLIALDKGMLPTQFTQRQKGCH
ncbi:uncharacterized protein LY89DRAFT_498195 [Mollisia scopiformis]|uniref:Zn(2)-C6 fungal-type domain-containing protein n=1 Tax=Mollisia scopiformis TaxID=149040 RepID=A0A194XFG4_MOLSC|nr:uncharacterized protein LY89DRAFT_498195 [Mollisia scopiformis]KUJ18512.1 hypothetical protein LY89DRAFT_498195 [Mollisia scopiformis]